MSKLEFLKVYTSPFKFVKPKFYIGKVAIGTPYFLPRKWVKSKTKVGHLESKPKKIGFDFVGLGWKIKFGDYRFEWAPVWSFVFFRWQIAIVFQAPEEMHFWECYLYYINEAKGDLNRAIKEYPCTWTKYTNGEKVSINYWELILKK